LNESRYEKFKESREIFPILNKKMLLCGENEKKAFKKFDEK